ncbi:MAG: BMP family ABC transporter substrate-binding protein [Clostridiales bacterium]|jgi:basic membrane lipoprotein|nr:BMP family ABC transporter substrate-binding protein [Clostridiales bacterium]
MKKVFSLVLVLAMCFSFAAAIGCGGQKDDDSGKKDDFLIGAIYINGQNDTAGYTYAHHKGITKAMEQLGMDKSQLKIVDNVLENDAEVTKAIDTLASQGCKMIIGISFGYLNAMQEAAEKPQYKDIIFSHATGYLSNDTNFNNYFGRIYQARYLSGIAAGMKTLETGNNNIGYVAAWGTEYAETCSGINAFAMGAQAVNPEAKVFVNKISTWGEESKERQAALNLIETYNCGVIGQHCDSAQPQIAAQEKNVFGCGYNSDMTVQAPKAHLTAPVWNWDVYYKLAIETAKNSPSEFMTKVGIYYGGLKEGFIDISPLSENCAEGTKEIIEKVKTMIVNGEWDVFTNVKLSISEDGTITKKEEALKDNKGGEVISADGNTYFVYVHDENTDTDSLQAVDGGKSAQDSVIKGSMNYYVAGVEAIN